MGIEPTCSAWKADVLPLNYARGVGRRPGGASRRGRVARDAERGASASADRRERDGQGASVSARGAKLVGRGGFEPPKAEPSDLQSDPFGRSGISPRGSLDAPVANAGAMLARSSAARRAPVQRGDGPLPVILERDLVFTERSREPRRGARRTAAVACALGAFAGGPRWSQRWDSNPQPPDYKSGALPIELRWRAARRPVRPSGTPPDAGLARHPDGEVSAAWYGLAGARVKRRAGIAPQTPLDRRRPGTPLPAARSTSAMRVARRTSRGTPRRARAPRSPPPPRSRPAPRSRPSAGRSPATGSSVSKSTVAQRRGAASGSASSPRARPAARRSSCRPRGRRRGWSSRA